MVDFLGFNATRNANNQADADLSERVARFKAISGDELGRYQANTLSTREQNEINQFQDTANKNVSDFSSKSNTSSSFQQSMQDHITMDTHLLKESMEEKTLARGLQALGFEEQEIQKLIDQHAAERKEKMAIFQGLMGAVGMSIAAFA